MNLHMCLTVAHFKKVNVSLVYMLYAGPLCLGFVVGNLSPVNQWNESGGFMQQIWLPCDLLVTVNNACLLALPFSQELCKSVKEEPFVGRAVIKSEASVTRDCRRDCSTNCPRDCLRDCLRL